VSAATALKVNRHRVRNGESVRFDGRLRGGHVPAGGKLLELQVLLRDEWRTFTTVHSNRRGRWRYTYRFGATRGTVVYLFRARIPREATYPFTNGKTGWRKVTVRG
jgi:hypothetical protein